MKMSTTCQKYSCINVPCKYRQIVDEKNIVITTLKKGKAVPVKDRRTCSAICLVLQNDKYLAILNTEKFLQLQKDPTSSLERKVQ